MRALLSTTTKEAISSDRLFEIYLQKEDMNMLVHDFRETEAFFGPVDTTDMYNWSQFLIDNSDDLDKYTKDFRDAEARVLQIANEAAGLAPVMKLKQIKKMLVVQGEKGKYKRN